MELIIKINQETRDVTCGACGKDTLIHRGPALYEEGTDRLICRSCGETHAAHLTALLDLSDAAETYVRTREYMSTNP